MLVIIGVCDVGRLIVKGGIKIPMPIQLFILRKGIVCQTDLLPQKKKILWR
jgi:hypothetical protein